MERLPDYDSWKLASPPHYEQEEEPVPTATIINPRQEGGDAGKYHANSDCRRLNKTGAVVVELDSALEQGYRPCNAWTLAPGGGRVDCWQHEGYVVAEHGVTA